MECDIMVTQSHNTEKVIKDSKAGDVTSHSKAYWPYTKHIDLRIG